MFTESLLSASTVSPTDIISICIRRTCTHVYSGVLSPEKWLTLEGLLEFQGRSNSAPRARVVTKGKTPSPEERVAKSLKELM